MRQAVRDGFLDFSITYESLCDWLYLDVKGLVTIGIGDLVDPPALLAGLVFIRPDGSNATSSEVQSAWLKVKNAQSMAKSGGGHFKDLTTIRATKDSIQRIVLAKLSLNESILKHTFDEWEDWPAKAQLATLSMTWAYGANFTHGWPKFTAACKAQDWCLASQECSASDAELSRQNQSFRDRNQKQIELFQQAAQDDDDKDRI